MAQTVIPRPALIERLRATPPGAVAVVCAPAGSGKTALLRSWCSQLDEPAVWVTVEREEHDAQRFWLSVIDALADAAPDDDLIERVSPSPEFAGAKLVARLLEQLELLPASLVLVVDDLHELRSTDALSLLERLLDRLPAQVRVALGTREAPALGLHRRRLAGDLVELHAPDLLFSPDETRSLLRSGGIRLTDDAIAKLHERTEGWAAGLRMAALALAEHPEPERFVAEFSGSERTIAAYLLTEVLGRQPAEVRNLLLRTSILERVSGPLADRLTGGKGAEAMLQRLAEENAFVAAIDAGRTWFRYHHLFADLLRLELRATTPDAIPSLHSAAAAWHAEHGDVVAAVRHAQAAGEYERAGRLLIDDFLALTVDGRGDTIHALLQVFPPATHNANPDLAAALAIDGILHGLLDQGAAQLDAARRISDTVAPERRRVFAVYLAVIGLELARRRGDLAQAEAEMRRLQAALDSPPDAGESPVAGDYRALAAMNLGIAELWAGEPEIARRQLDDALDRARRIGRPFIEVGCLAHLSIAALLCGTPLPLAVELSERAIAIAEEHGWTGASMTAGAYALDGFALVRMGRFAEAEQQLDRAEAVLRTTADAGTELVLLHSRAILRFGQGHYDEALAQLARVRELEGLLAGEHVLIVEARTRAPQVLALLGDTAAAEAAIAALESAAPDGAGTRIARAALELARDDPEQALAALAPVTGGSAPALIVGWARAEALLLAALAYDQLGDRAAAERSLEASLELAEPEGLILPYLLWPSRALLEAQPRHRTAHATLIDTILAALAGRAPSRAGRGAPLREELSDAELRVVRYLPGNLNSSEIAAELFVSSNTVRTHLRHIYGKLDVHSRSDAVARARELGLLAPGAPRR